MIPITNVVLFYLILIDNLKQCLLWALTLYGAHVRQVNFYLRVCHVFFFLGVSLFLPHLLISPSHMSLNNLERDIKLN